jgi:predicted RNA-binding protein with PIN domain
VAGTVVVDAENVRRSAWPNVSRQRLVGLVARWVAREGVGAVVVFDGPPPPMAVPVGVELRGVAGTSADDLIVRLVPTLSGRVTVATSDRALRDRLSRFGAEIRGGGSFLEELRER